MTATTHGQVPAIGYDVSATRRVLVQAVAGTLLVMLDFNAPLTTLTATARTLGASVQQQTWMLSGISLGLASALLVAGALGDEIGRRRVFVAGTVLLTAATLGAAVAPDAWTFVAARIVQGIAGGAVLACGLGLIAEAFPDPAPRKRATGIWGASLGAGIAIGPLLAAWIAALATWRSVYAVEAVLAVALTVAATRLPLLAPARTRRVDVAGALTLVAAVTLLVTGLVEGRLGWEHPATTLPLGAAVLALVLFVLLERARPMPLVELDLFRSRGFLAASAAALVTGVAVIGFMSYLPTVLQRGLGESPAASAGVLAVWSGISAVVALGARRLPVGLTGRWQLVGGLVLCAAGLLALADITIASSWETLVPGLVMIGVGSGVLNAALGRLAVESVPFGRAAMGSGANNTARYVGSSAGIAVVVAVTSAHAGRGTGRLQAADLVGGMNVAALTCAAVAMVGAAIIVSTGARRATGRRRPIGVAGGAPSTS